MASTFPFLVLADAVASPPWAALARARTHTLTSSAWWTVSGLPQSSLPVRRGTPLISEEPLTWRSSRRKEWLICSQPPTSKRSWDRCRSPGHFEKFATTLPPDERWDPNETSHVSARVASAWLVGPFVKRVRLSRSVRRLMIGAGVALITVGVLGLVFSWG